MGINAIRGGRYVGGAGGGGSRLVNKIVRASESAQFAVRATSYSSSYYTGYRGSSIREIETTRRGIGL